MSDIYSPEDFRERVRHAREYNQEAHRRAQERYAPYEPPQDYYTRLRQEYPDLMPDVSNLTYEDYQFLDNISPLIAASPNPTETRDRIISAAAFSNALNIPLDQAFLSLDALTEGWTGAAWTPASGLKAVTDSLRVGLLGIKQNRLAIKYHDSGQDPEVLRELEEVEGQIEALRDRVPKIWQKEYVWRGGFGDIGPALRSIFTGAAESLAHTTIGAGSSSLVSTAVHAVGTAAGLPTWLSGVITIGAGTLTIAGTSYATTVGTEYRDLINQGIPDDIAWTTANVSSIIQGAIEAVGGGVISSTMKGFIKTAAPAVIGKSLTSFFIKGKMGLLGKAATEYIKELFGEGFEEGAQSLTGSLAYNWAVDVTNERRTELLQKLHGEMMEDVRRELEAELEKYPELQKKEFDEIFEEMARASWGGFMNATILGFLGAASNYRGDLRNSRKIAVIARNASSDTSFQEAVYREVETGGLEIPGGEDMSAEEQKDFLSNVYQAQQKRIGPEERAARERDAGAIAARMEVTDYSNVNPEIAVDEATGKEYETGELKANVAANIYRENGRLVTDIDEVEQDNGIVRGEFAFGDPRVADDGNRDAQYGHIDYTIEGDQVRVDRFQMMEGYENLRGEAYQEFAEYFAGKDISWNPVNEENSAIREQLVTANPRGPNAGLNYAETLAEAPVSREARVIAERIQPYLPKATPLETALVVDAFNFMRRPGEDINQAFNRLGIQFTNEPAQDMNAAAQRQGDRLKGATWAEQTAEGMKRIIYLNRNSADASTLAHELLHIAGKNLGADDLKALARALNGYQLRNGMAVDFDENTITPESFMSNTAQQEAFSEAGENYLTNGQAPTEELKGVFDRIKDFMKRVFRTMAGWTKLSPQAEGFYRSLFSGEMIEPLQEGPRSGEKAPGQAAGSTDMVLPSETDEDPDIAAIDESPDTTAMMERETAITGKAGEMRDRVIGEPAVPLEDKAGAILDMAAEAALGAETLKKEKTEDHPIPDVLFQKSDAQIIEEGATFPSWREWMEYEEAFGDAPLETVFLTLEEKEKWYKTAWEEGRKAVVVVQPVEDDSGVAAPAGDAAQMDQEFITYLDTPGVLEDFLEAASNYEETRFKDGALNEEDQSRLEQDKKMEDQVRNVLSHPTWRSAIASTIGNKPIKNTIRKSLITMMKHSPRDYRDIYSHVMDAPQWAVSEEDSTAAVLRYRMANANRGIGVDLERLSPEKRRQISIQLNNEDMARRFRNGSIKLGEMDQEVKEYVSSLNKQIKETRKKLEAQKEQEQEDNEYLQHNVETILLREHERMITAREQMALMNNALTRALNSGITRLETYTRAARNAAATYYTITRRLEALKEASKLSRKAELAIARREEREELRAHIRELQQKKRDEKIERTIKRNLIKRTMRRINLAEIDAQQAMPMAVIQALVEPSLLQGVNQFVGQADRPYIQEIVEAWKTDEVFREGLIKEAGRERGERITEVMKRAAPDGTLNTRDIKTLLKNLPKKDWARALGLDEIVRKRNSEIFIKDIKEVNRDGKWFAEPGEQSAEIAQKYLPAHLYYLIRNVPYAEWTVAQAEELAKIMDDLTVEGKQRRKAAIMLDKQRMAEYRQKAIEELKKTRVELKDTDTPEEREAKLKKMEDILGKYDFGPQGTMQNVKNKGRHFLIPSYFATKKFQFFRMLDNGNEHGINTSLTYRRASDARDQELTNVDRRNNTVKKVMKEAGIADHELWKLAVTVDLGGKLKQAEYTVAEVLGLRSAVLDDKSKDAILYGNLLHEDERLPYQKEGMDEAGRAALRDMASERYAKVSEAINNFFQQDENKKFLKLMDAINKDFQESGERVNIANIEYSNQFVDILDHYFPIDRVGPESQTESTRQVRAILGASSGPANLFADRGFVKSRVNIPPEYQTSINLDIMKVWTDSVAREEHFIAYGKLVKDLHNIYGVKAGRQVRAVIQRRYGEGALRYIDGFIDELAVPDARAALSGIGKVFKLLRGGTITGYLAFKPSSVIKQAITSPWPFLPYVNPLEYLSAIAQWAAHPVRVWEQVQELSPKMKHRSFSTMADLVHEAEKESRGNALHSLNKISETGMKGLEWIDRLAVVPGWLALYNKEHKRLSAEGKHSENDTQILAARYADDITQRVQPFSDKLNLSPMFALQGDAGELAQLFIQFTQSLNTIYNNIRYDVPQQIRDKQLGNVIGGLTGYIAAGVLLGCVTVGFDEDDSEEDRRKKLAFWASTQFTDAIPIMGSSITDLLESLATGDRRFRNSFNPVPAWDSLTKTLTKTVDAAQEKSFEKTFDAVLQLIETAALSGGAPVSGAKELWRGLGIGEEGPQPEAFLGRK